MKSRSKGKYCLFVFLWIFVFIEDKKINCFNENVCKYNFYV